MLAACAAPGSPWGGPLTPVALSRSKKGNEDGDPGAGPLLTLFQFLFISAVCLRDVVSWQAGPAAPPPP